MSATPLHTLSGNPPTKVSLRVPATTANLGPGYDTLGMAMSIFMDLTVEVADTYSFEVEGEGKEHIATDNNLLTDTCRIAFEKYAKKPMPPLHFSMRNNIPFGCGCGSSSAAAVAGFVAGMLLAGFTMETRGQEELLAVIAKIEGHPDNAAPAIYGGIQLGCKRESGDDVSFVTSRVPTPPNLSIVLFTPKKLMKASTEVTRNLVPQTTALSNAIHNISRSSLLVLALCSNKLELLKDCSDRLHENYRADQLYPHYRPCAKAAMEHGAEYAFLSGAGPTVCAFVSGRRGDILTQPEGERRVEQVAQAMLDAARAAGVEGRAIITQPSDLGVHLSGVHSSLPNVSYVNI
ncbi:homoserine kinase [Strigomonas culicis]|uniref:Homoserine kinase n=3 Tax=Strigomonas culicis TaxID=28005 RepID=S9UY76_9TRYP|nr:homoserine kinase [Strigomonas culicis]EPY28188.1 homoserine kinase [Strigomonas culicis]EPY33793.1 homoserine kinase [Strigomonas culicis]|eukprot:EPY28188.1 homoserine kinase [Strigomonas culicis]